MTKIGIGLPAESIDQVLCSSKVSSKYNFDSFSVYGELGDLRPHSALYACVDF